jgi:hypothetical protein
LLTLDDTVEFFNLVLGDKLTAQEIRIWWRSCASCSADSLLMKTSARERFAAIQKTVEAQICCDGLLAEVGFLNELMRLHIVGLAAMSLLTISTQVIAQDKPPTVGYWHVWSDKNGVSHQNRCELGDFELKSISPPAAPSWQDVMKAGASNTIVTLLPAGWVGNWHKNPKPQWIVPLSGRWFVQTMDGKRVEMGPGDLSLGEDQRAKPDAKGENGHLSGSIGHAPAVLMLVQIAPAATIGGPCRFK